MENVPFSSFHNIGMYLINPMHQDPSNIATTPSGVKPGCIHPISDKSPGETKITSSVMPDSPPKITEIANDDAASLPQINQCCVVS